MIRPAYSILYSAPVAVSAANGGPGSVLFTDPSTGSMLLATAANRGLRRSTGIALTTFVSGGVVDLQQNGELDVITAGLGPGTASWVRVSAGGALERCTPSGSDDVVGWAETDGTVHLLFGLLTAAIVTGGGGGGGATLPIDLTSQVTGLLPTANGGSGTASTTGSGSLVFHNAPVFTTPQINNTGGTFRYIINPAAIVANRTVSLPLLTGNDTFCTVAATQTLTGKTIDAASNTISNLTPASQKAAQAVGALAIDWDAGNVFTKTLAAGANVFTFTNASSGEVIIVRLTGAASTVTWPTVKWAGGVAPTQTASGTDVYTFVHDGTNIYGSVVQAMA